MPYFQRILSVSVILGIEHRATGKPDKSWEPLPQFYKGVRTSDGEVLENFMTVVEIPSPLLCVCVLPLLL